MSDGASAGASDGESVHADRHRTAIASMNLLMNTLAREARDGTYTVFNEEGEEKKHIPPQWWQEDT